MKKGEGSFGNIIVIFIIVLVAAILLSMTFLFTANLKSTLPSETLYRDDTISIYAASKPNYNVDESVNLFFNEDAILNDTFVLYRNTQIVEKDNYTQHYLNGRFYINLLNNSYTVSWMQDI